MSDSIRVPSTPENLRHGNFNPAAEPIARVPTGERVTIETVSPYSVGLLTEQGIAESDILDDERGALREGTREGPGPHVVTGPIHVEGAEPGAVLAVHVEDVRLRTGYGVNSFQEGVGVLSDAFSALDIRVLRQDRERGVVRFGDGIEVPIEPFFGIVAVAPSDDVGRVSTTPPSTFGGNLDLALLGAGSTIYLPVQVDGAHVYVGDGHAAQGDGEVDSTAIETSLTGDFRFELHEDVPRLAYPLAETTDHYVVVGLGETLDGALSHAVERTISFLASQKGMAATEAYRLSSIAADFAVTQAVNGTVGVHGLVPKSVFEDGGEIDPRRLDDSFRASSVECRSDR